MGHRHPRLELRERNDRQRLRHVENLNRAQKAPPPPAPTAAGSGWRGSRKRAGMMSLLQFDDRALSLELLFDLFRFLLGHAFLHRAGRALHQVLGLLQAQAGDRPDLFDHLNLLFPAALQDDGELRLLLDGSGRAGRAPASRRRASGAGSAPAPCPNSSSRVGRVASRFTCSGVTAFPATTPTLIVGFSCSLTKSASTLAAATGSAPASTRAVGPSRCDSSPGTATSFSARRAKVFFTTT